MNTVTPQELFIVITVIFFCILYYKNMIVPKQKEKALATTSCPVINENEAKDADMLRIMAAIKEAKTDEDFSTAALAIHSFKVKYNDAKYFNTLFNYHSERMDKCGF